MQKYKLIACDVDGTLLNSRRKLSEKTVSAVGKAIDKGIIFVVATGRPYEGALKVSRPLGISDDGAFILFNGALVKVSGKTIFSSQISEETAKTIVKEGICRNVTVIVWKSDGMYTEKPCEKIDFYKSVSGVEPKYVDDLTKECKGVIKVLWYGEPDTTPVYLEEMRAILDKKASVYTSRVDFLEFVDVKCSKKQALYKIAEYFGVKREETVAVGDGDNDIPMLEGAGLSVAMGNADENVKKICDEVTDDCDSYGVAKIIDKLILNGRL